MHIYGIDIGSVSIKCAEFLDDKLKKTSYLKHFGKPFNVLLSLLKKARKLDKLVLTGGSARQVQNMLGALYVNEVESTTYGVLKFYPDIRSIIEIGGEDSKLININRGIIQDFASNTICAAGTGIFLDQQAHRLCFSIEDFSKIALNARNPARIAGRCSVFAKSDMIHLQQIGTQPEDLVSGLCLALARNFKSVIAQGKRISTPVAFVGGVAGNQGMVRAFQRVLGITQEDLIIPEFYNCAGAIGAVLKSHGRTCPAYKGTSELADWLAKPRILKRLPPLNGHKKLHPMTLTKSAKQKTKAYLGVDVGSISTNLVLIDDQGNVLARRYLWTKGRPIEVVLMGLAELEKEIADRVEIISVGTTGSGRYLIGEFIGADLIKNEISAQARAAIEIDQQVDTIFEIGGQDSKFISLHHGTIVDFEMNKVCAAGTGSFLEEQAEVLDVKLEDFGDMAIKAQSPINLGERCTVFIGSEVIHHQSDVNERENLLAGLGYSIAHNYINRVVSGKRIGERIFFQGGVAANKAVIAAFEQILKKDIVVPVNYDITGAIGIALLARDRNMKNTRFRGFDLTRRSYSTSSFVCNHCSNECEINKIVVENEKTIYYGGRCERYERQQHTTEDSLPDLFTMRNNIFFATEDMKGTEIGIPRSLIFYELFPFFYKFLTELGFKPILSPTTTRKIIEYGAEISVADTCLPVKIALGHMQELINQGITHFFIPSVITMPEKDERFDRCYVCPYVQTLPYMARAVFDRKIKISSPGIYFDRGQAGIEEALISFGKTFNKNERQVIQAIKKAQQYQIKIQKEIAALGKDILKDIDDFAFVVCSRPYNGFDLGMNLNIPKKIRDLGVTALPVDLIPLDYSVLKDDFSNMYWHYGQRILAAAEAIRNNDKLFAVYLSNFSCGPDSFVTRYFKEKQGSKPFLLIEIDEHSGDAGFITRCEAFHDSIKGAQRRSGYKKIEARSEVKKNRTIYIPYMCDGARILASAMKYTGIDARVLPPPDEDSIIIGRQYTSGRECFPAILTAGDMVKKINSPDFDPSRSAFFMAQGSGPCRFGQYYKLHRLILNELGYSTTPIYAPNQGPSLYDDLGPMGLKFLYLVWEGICAVDALEAKARMIRPYEKNRGETDRIYNQVLNEICERVERGKGIGSLLRRKRIIFDNIVRVHKDRKPRIGIVGEIYVRSQKYSNSFIEQKLENLGCEVAMPSIGEWFFYTNFTRARNCQWFRQYRRAGFTKLFNQFMKWRHKRIFNFFGLNSEADISKLLNYAQNIIHHSFEGEAILTIGKTIEFVKENFSGVVNVMPFTCMPGNITTTLYKSIKDQHPNFPLFILSLDGLDHAVDVMRLETFVSQAKNYRSKTDLLQGSCSKK